MSTPLKSRHDHCRSATASISDNWELVNTSPGDDEEVVSLAGNYSAGSSRKTVDTDVEPLDESIAITDQLNERRTRMRERAKRLHEKGGHAAQEDQAVDTLLRVHEGYTDAISSLTATWREPLMKIARSRGGYSEDTVSACDKCTHYGFPCMRRDAPSGSRSVDSVEGACKSGGKCLVCTTLGPDQ